MLCKPEIYDGVTVAPVSDVIETNITITNITVTSTEASNQQSLDNYNVWTARMREAGQMCLQFG